MRICLVGSYSGPLDEGTRNVSSSLARELSKRHQVVTMDLSRSIYFRSWQKVREFRPQVITYLAGPSPLVFLMATILSMSSRGAKVIFSTVSPRMPAFFRKFASLMKPDLVLAQSAESERFFRSLGYRTVPLIVTGVDVYRFIPVAAEVKTALRTTYGVLGGKFIMLHVGPIKEGRNLKALCHLQSNGGQVIVVGSTSMNMEPDIFRELRDNGCRVWRSFFPRIEEIYQLADAYIFPTVSSLNSAEVPLSVMEAMSCNLPVVSTRFGALPRIFDEGDGLQFIDSEGGFSRAIQKLKAPTQIKTREKVLPYSWANIAARLEQTYVELL